MSAAPVQIVYLVSRFPRTSETFIVREVDGLSRLGRFDISLRSLFPSPDTAVHEASRRWTDRVRRPSGVDALLAFGWALVRHPLALMTVLALVVAGHRRSPRLLPRALVTVVLACAHARDIGRTTPNAHIHAHYATYPALAAWVCHRLIGITYSFTAHAHDLYVDQSMLSRKMAEATFVVTISEYNRRLLNLRNDVKTAVHVVHCGIETSNYPFRPREPAAEGPVRVLCVASLQEYKGHEILLRALAAGGTGVDRIELDLIGDGPLRAPLTELARDLGLGERVRFLGARTEVFVAEKLASTDVFVLPSVVAADGQMEGLPVALMEALASGVPTVSTSLSGIPEIIVDGVTGALARPGDVDDLRRALEATIARGGEVIRLADAGRELVQREFELAVTLGELVALFDHYLGADQAPPPRR
ncbi:colanic acid biosynthesis glycosyltransferase WcaL [Williamsia sp. 1138]|uniref:glycosyltransferase n=1 Tax=Williamsia sp. 1138 TaxID=1903117 RepID=UPI000A0F8EBA|nr:glycosyltransferase [Williamsia sp. 1138]OZG29178.1 colanic acid biosynthesis glycosyltransferase WcaL [Williamsia sp. 1138]